MNRNIIPQRFKPDLAVVVPIDLADLPVTPEWRSQQEFAGEAKAMRDDPSTEREARVATLRLQMVADYRTAPLPRTTAR